MTWIKPPWAAQIDSQNAEFFVGAHVDSGLLKLSCTEPYFTNERLYARAQDLQLKKHVYYDVLTLTEALDTTLSLSKKTFKKLSRDLKPLPFVLDIDLDFFSTQNPFLEVYSEKQRAMMREIYNFQPPKSRDVDSLLLHQEERNAYFCKLEQVLTEAQRSDQLPTNTDIQW